MRAGVIGACVLLLALGASAQERGEYLFPDRPAEREFVSDGADLIAPGDEAEIRRIADQLLTEKAVPIIVVTISSLAEYNAFGSIESYARDLFDEWGIGYQKWNHGILLVVAVEDRKARIELGADWGSRKNGETDQIMNELIIPSFKRGEFSTGIVRGVEGLDAMARELKIPAPPKPPWFWPAIIITACLAVFTGISLYRRGSSGWAWLFWGAVFTIIFVLLRAAASGSSSSGGGFSGGSFGGGSSGGGGSTGSW
ncbi:MAG: TPM domain-containing protein [Deltaproteobacteria bacterium]|nr:TPM domain-containing protein [Deltaproteobacteria bacterium]